MSGSSTLPPTDPQGGGSLVDAAKEGYAAQRSALEAEDGRSLGEMLSAVTTNVSTLMQQEMALAKAELKQSGTRAGKGIGLFAGAAVAGLAGALIGLVVSVAFFAAFSGGTKPHVRALCRRSASLIRSTRISRDIATIILRTVSA